jgi:hypothetical protein
MSTLLRPFKSRRLLYVPVCIATCYGMEDRSSSDRVKIFLFSTSSRSALGPTQPPIQWVRVAISSGVKRPRREADNSPPTGAEDNKMWIYTSIPLYAFTG